MASPRLRRRSAERNGSLKDVQKALEENGCKWVLFNEVEENPSVETIMKARDLGISEGVDLVIGIGGGSPMDAAKAIAMMLLHKDADWAYLYDGKTPSTISSKFYCYLFLAVKDIP